MTCLKSLSKKVTVEAAVQVSQLLTLGSLDQSKLLPSTAKEPPRIRFSLGLEPLPFLQWPLLRAEDEM